MFGGWEHTPVPDILLSVFGVHLRGQTDEEKDSFLIWGQEQKRGSSSLSKPAR